MNRIRFAACSLAILGAALSARADDAPASSVTFSGDVAPILQTHCQACHRPGEAAPMSLLTYADARPWAKSIKKAVAERAMPPWHADPAIGKWRNNPSLTDAEIKAITSWADGGAPEGNPADLPPARAWTPGWLMGEPDMVFTLPQEQVLAPELVDQYRYLQIPMNLSEDIWVQAVEVRPGNREVVHHVNVFETSGLNSPESLKQLAAFAKRTKEAGEKVRRMGGQGTSPQGEGAGRVGGFLPGGLPLILPEGDGVLLPAKASLMLQIHYHKDSGQEARDRTSVGVKLCKAPPARRVHGGSVDECRFVIPAGAANHPVDAYLDIQEDIHITAFSPHMHLRGKDFKVWAELPGGERKEILNVPRYDFNWQTTYEPAEPVALPAGTKLRTIAHFDNSRGNPFNPNPDADVEWGEPTTDEMMLMFFRYTKDKNPLGK